MCKILQRLFRLCEINVNTDSTLGSGKQTRLASLPTSSDIFRHLPTHGPGYIKPLLDYKLPYQIPFLFYTEIGLGDVLTPAIRWIENLGFNCQSYQLVVGISSCWLGLSPKIKPSCPTGRVHLYWGAANIGLFERRAPPHLVVD
jgi:hypothetical protein